MMYSVASRRDGVKCWTVSNCRKAMYHNVQCCKEERWWIQVSPQISHTTLRTRCRAIQCGANVPHNVAHTLQCNHIQHIAVVALEEMQQTSDAGYARAILLKIHLGPLQYNVLHTAHCSALADGMEDIPSSTATAYLCHSIRLFGGKALMGGGENIFLPPSNIQRPSTNKVLIISFPVSWPIHSFRFVVVFNSKISGICSCRSNGQKYFLRWQFLSQNINHQYL